MGWGGGGGGVAAIEFKDFNFQFQLRKSRIPPSNLGFMEAGNPLTFATFWATEPIAGVYHC